MAILRPTQPRPVESTQDELKTVLTERRRIRARTSRLEHLLADYRRQDDVLK